MEQPTPDNRAEEDGQTRMPAEASLALGHDLNPPPGGTPITGPTPLTFLLTDIEQSVPLWEQEADAMQRALARHDAIIDECVTRYGGTVVQQHGEGDSRFA